MLNAHTTTLYTGNTQMILPSDENGNQKMDFGISQTDDASRLHIVIPAKDINVLNAAHNVSNTH